MEREIHTGCIVEHFKRELCTREERLENPMKYFYYISDFATHTETGEQLVIYRALYNDKDNGIYIGKTFACPYDMFMSEVDKEKYPNIKRQYRFTLLSKLD